MSWLTFTWSMIASACLTLGLFHAAVGLKLKTRANLWFALTAFGSAATAIFEIVSMRASTAERWGDALRWGHPVLFVVFVSVIGFVRAYFRAGRPWLGWVAIATRAASLVVNFAKPPNLNYVSITGVESIPFWFGEHVFVPVGTVSRWTLLGQAASILILVFIIDAARTVWRRNDRRQALICGSTVLFVLVAVAQPAAVHAGLIRAPYLISIAYLGVVATMSYDLTRDVVKATELARRLQASEAGLIDTRVVALRAKSEALRAEERFRLVFEAAPSAMVLVDERGRIALVNAQAESLFGFTREELVGISVDDVLPDGARVDDPVRAGDAPREVHARRKDGTDVPVEIALNSVRSGEAGYVLASVVDLRERRRNARELEQQRNEVAHLSRLNLLGEIAGSLAHELSQPLTAMLANAQAGQRFLRRVPPDLVEIDAVLADIVEENRHAGDVIGRLRTMLRKGDRNRERLALSELVDDVLRLARSDLLNHGVGAETEVDAGLPSIHADRVQLLQVLLNLVVNGCDAMADTAPGDRRLFFRMEQADGQVHLSVSDRGSGIPSGSLETIFEPFVTTKRQGMGLGLAVCRTIVDGHGGRIWATNNAAGGATLHLTFPISGPEGLPNPI